MEKSSQITNAKSVQLDLILLENHKLLVSNVSILRSVMKGTKLVCLKAIGEQLKNQSTFTNVLTQIRVKEDLLIKTLLLIVKQGMEVSYALNVLKRMEFSSLELETTTVIFVQNQFTML